jgi:hypothetical protein
MERRLSGRGMANTIQYLYVCQVLYAFAIALTKIAIISSYLRFIQDKAFCIAMYVISVTIASLWVTGKAHQTPALYSYSH